MKSSLRGARNSTPRRCACAPSGGVRGPRRIAHAPGRGDRACAAGSPCQRVTARAKASSPAAPSSGAPISRSSCVAQRGRVERGRGVRAVRVHRLALHELALDDVERRELVMPRLERAHLVADAEQRGEEVLEMRRERDQELGLGLAVERIGRVAGGGEARRQRRDRPRAVPRRSGGRCVASAVARVEVGEGETVRRDVEHRCVRTARGGSRSRNSGVSYLPRSAGLASLLGYNVITEAGVPLARSTRTPRGRVERAPHSTDGEATDERSRALCSPSSSLVLALPAAAQTIKLGELNSYKVFPAFLEPYKKGMELALEEINAAGGVLGRKLEIVVARRQRQARRRRARRRGADLAREGRAADGHVRVATSASPWPTSPSSARSCSSPSEPLTDKIVWENGNAYTYRLRASTYMQTAMLVPEAAKLEQEALGDRLSELRVRPSGDGDVQAADDRALRRRSRVRRAGGAARQDRRRARSCRR